MQVGFYQFSVSMWGETTESAHSLHWWRRLHFVDQEISKIVVVELMLFQKLDTTHECYPAH